MGRPRPRSSSGKKFRMSELVEESGVSRDMIKYYLRAKLLPKPHKPRPNLALYSEQHLALIRLILRFQAQTKLSLPDIATVFLEVGHDTNALEIELLADRHSGAHRDNIIPFEASTNSNVSLTFPADFLAELVNNGLLQNAQPLDDNDEKIAGLLWAASSEGVPLSFFHAARAKLRELADLEVKTLIAIRRPGLDFEGVVAGVTDVDRVINRWIITEKTAQASRMFQRIIENSEQAVATVHDAIYFPSKVFRQRFAVDEKLAQLAAGLSKKPAKLAHIHEVARSCLLLTAFEQALAIADTALAKAPDDDIAIAIKCLAYSMDNKLEAAIGYAQRLQTSDPHHPMAIEARILTLLMQAAKLGGVSDTSELLKDAAELFREPLHLREDNQADLLESGLLEARANTIFPDAINNEHEAIGTLETMLATLANNSYEELGLLLDGERVVYQVYANFYLGQLYAATDDKVRSRSHFEHVIQLDPSSNFGEMAYLKLS